jgi:hypothetical protein
MRVKLALAGEGGGARPPTLITFTITSKVAVLPPSPPQLIQPQWLTLSFSFTHRDGTCLPLLASKGNRGGPNHTTAKQMWFSSLLLFHAYMQSHSFSISNLVLAVPSTEILEWITDLYTSKHFT